MGAAKYALGELLQVRLKPSTDPKRSVVDAVVRQKNGRLSLYVLPESHKVLGGVLIDTRECSIVKRKGWAKEKEKPSRPSDRGKYELSPLITRVTSFPQTCPCCRTSNTFWHNDVCLACHHKGIK